MIHSLPWQLCAHRFTVTMPHSSVLRIRRDIDQAITDILVSTDETKRQELYTLF